MYWGLSKEIYDKVVTNNVNNNSLDPRLSFSKRTMNNAEKLKRVSSSVLSKYFMPRKLY